MSTPGADRSWPRVRQALWATTAFGLSYTQLPLYTSNQTHHMLAGLAAAGRGWLRDDWQVHSADPFPVFTLIVRGTTQFLHEWWFYAYYQALIAAYVWGVVGVVGEVFPECKAPRARLMLIAILAALHSEVLGYLLGFDARHMYWWQMFTWGVAEQEIFGHAMFQGSAFGLLLPWSLLLFLRNRPWLGATLAGLVVVVHPGYALLAAGMAAGGACAVARGGRRPLVAASVLAWFAVLIAPIFADAYVRFAATSATTWAQASSVLIAHLPVETMPARWFGAKAGLQMAWVLWALWIVRGTPVVTLLWPAAALGATLTLVQIATGSPALALAFPWRVSVLLVPMSTALILGACVRSMVRSGRWRRAGCQRLVSAGAALALIALAGGGLAKMTLHFGYFYGVPAITGLADRVVPARHIATFSHDLRTDAVPMLGFVGRSARRGETYLIPLDLERFRTSTGAPAYVDLKSHPYKDVEVLAWRDRVDVARRVLGKAPACDQLSALSRGRLVTHVVAGRDSPVGGCPGLDVTYRDANFSVLRIRGGS